MSDMTLPADYFPVVPAATLEETRLVKLAREIAMDLHPLEKILEVHAVSKEDFERLKVTPYFCRLLGAEIGAWQTAGNTQERVKLKAGAMIEEFLPGLYARMIDPKEDLMKAVKAAELATKLAGLGVSEARTIDPNDRISITINLGEDSKLVYRPVPPEVTQTIEHQSTFEESLSLAVGATDVSN